MDNDDLKTKMSDVERRLSTVESLLVDSLRQSSSGSTGEKKAADKRLRCSFCGKSQDSVTKLIAGPGVYICNECVDLCNEIIQEEVGETFPDLSNADTELSLAVDRLLVETISNSEIHVIIYRQEPSGIKVIVGNSVVGNSAEENILSGSALEQLINCGAVALCGNKDNETFYQLTWSGLNRARELKGSGGPEPLT